MLAGLIVFLGGLIAVAWYYGQTGDRASVVPAADRVENGTVSDMLKQASVINQAEASTAGSPVTVPIGLAADVFHSDVYFEVGRKGLTDEAKAQLAAHAELLKQQGDYGVLIQGYTDQQGSARYNLALGLNRAETIKAELVNAGVASHRIKTVSLGEEGVLCADASDVCRRMNRRAHLEIRKIGQEHMPAPVLATTSQDPATDAADTPREPASQETGSENPVPLPSDSTGNSAIPTGS
jgi:peptidoglycan-associated lipoprotein